jgi:hypothetical protein
MADQAETAINTYTGKVIDFADPDSGQIDIQDIAWGLSRICRFGAQALHFHSVAQHSIAVAVTSERLGGPEVALAALHHDSHEAYSADIPRPLKRLLEPAYGGITGRLDLAIATALGIEFPDKESDEGRLVKSIDDAAFVIEAETLLRDRTSVAGDEMSEQEDKPGSEKGRSRDGQSNGVCEPADNFRLLTNRGIYLPPFFGLAAL